MEGTLARPCESLHRETRWPLDPVELTLSARSTQGSLKLLDIAGARIEFLGAEHFHQTAVRARNHERRG